MSKIFSLSEAGSIAIHSMILIAKSENNLNVVKIAEQTGASKHHVAKVLQRLAKDDFLDSNRGPHGGFRLKRPADQISLLQVYEAIEGKIAITKCPMDNPICPFDKCIFSNIITTMTHGFKDYLDTQKLSDYLE
ncbi:MAG: Rrf2 family transcriptional regulator [Bacteroidales bacterium]|nr:Rrf2 family transcriptional regulator [Bacteroidales bacterium]